MDAKKLPSWIGGVAAASADGVVEYLCPGTRDKGKKTLKSQGIKVIRFENFLVFQELEYVLHRIQTNFEWWKPENNDSPPG
jgi:very-short-patch-repair endonuclease